MSASTEYIGGNNWFDGGSGTYWGDIADATHGGVNSDLAALAGVQRLTSPANLAITTNPDVQQMPSVAVNPLDADHVVIAYMDYSLVDTGYAGIGVAMSRDGGSNWEYSSIPLPANFDQGAANPVVKFDNVDHDGDSTNGVQNRAYLVFMAATFQGPLPPLTNPGGGPPRALGLQSNNGIFVARSDDGGSTWNADHVSTVTSQIYDGVTKVPFEIIPDLAIDTFETLPDGSQNSRFGTLYVNWSRYYPAGQYPGEAGVSDGGSNIMVAVSRDGGKTWELQLESHLELNLPQTTVIFNEGVFTGIGFPEGAGLENWSHITVGPEGDVYISQFLGGQFHVHHSTDGAKSFTHPKSATGALMPFGVNEAPFPFPMSTQRFRLAQPLRAIVADPLRPGHVYAAEASTILDAEGNILDEGEIIFARSTDYGATWQTAFGVGLNAAANVVNDDNGGQTASGQPGEIASGQAMPRLVVDANGNVALIWYDTRRDPANHLLDVYAAVSTDGGQTFSPNFRVSDASFDADHGVFTDSTGTDNYYLSDFVGMALAHTAEGENVMYAAWTDTRNGNQDVVFSRVSLTPIPDPPNDRFEPNDSREDAVRVGPDPVFDTQLTQIALVAGEDDWFEITPPTGLLEVTASALGDASNLQLALYDAQGEPVSADTRAMEDTSGGAVTGQVMRARVTSGESYFVRVYSTADAGSADVDYSLRFATVTDNLGEVVHRVVEFALEDGTEAYYILQSKVTGSIRAALTVADGFQGEPIVELFDLQDPTHALASGTAAAPVVTALVDAGQLLLVRVAGGAAAEGAFRLELTNFDQFTFASQTTFADSAKNSLLFPTSSGASAIAIADLNGDDHPDIVASHVGQNIISVLLNNGDGTFQAPREFAIGAFQQGGPFTAQGLPNFHRDLAIDDFDRDGNLDVMVVNTSSADVSLLLGNGDGTFQPHRRFDATAAPFALAVGDLNGDNIPDFAVVDSTASTTAQVAVRLGRGDGSFLPPIFFELPNREDNRTNTLRIADVDGDGIPDLIERDFRSGTTLLLGNGDGTFRSGVQIQMSAGPGLAIADLDGDGDVDFATTRNNASELVYTLNNGDGTFSSTPVFVGQFPVAVDVGDVASIASDGSTLLGVPDGRPDLIVANNGRELLLFSGPPEIVVLANRGLDEQNEFAGFNAPVRLASAKAPLDVKVTNVNPDDDDLLDVVVVDQDGITVIYGKQPAIEPNDTPDTARDLGTVVHLVQPTLTIVPDRADAYYKLTVPEEVFAGAGDQVLDFSGGVTNETGAGLMMEVRDASGNLRGSGERFRVVAKQGEELFVHVFGVPDDQQVPGAGAYTLVINVLPQVANVTAEGLVPDGPATSLVLVFQGDRLDAATAEDPANYVVTWLGPDGVPGGDDDQIIPVGMNLPAGSKPIVYNPSRNNVDATSGQSLPTAVRQTVALLFGGPLPVGNYEVQVSANVTATTFNLQEASLLSSPVDDQGNPIFNGHPVVTVVGGTVQEGFAQVFQSLVVPAALRFNLDRLTDGTTFLTQFHGDAGALLDALLSLADDPTTVTQNLTDQIIAAFGPAVLGMAAMPSMAAGPITSLLVILLDPVSINLLDPTGRSFTYDLTAERDQAVANNLRRAFVEVGGNVEVIVIANPSDAYLLRVADVPARARGAAVYFNSAGVTPYSFTNAMRSGVRAFEILSPVGAAVRAFAPALLGFAPTVATQLQAAPMRADAASTRFDAAAVRARALTEIFSRSAAFAARAIAGPAYGGGSSVINGSWQEAVEQAWNELAAWWDDLEGEDARAEGGGRKANEDTVQPSTFIPSPLLRVWRVMSEIVDEVINGDDTEPNQPASGDEQTSHERADASTTQQETGQAAMDAARSGDAAAEAKLEDPAHATAA